VRDAERAFVVEGPRAVTTALDRGARPEIAYLGPGASRAFPELVARLDACGVALASLREGVLQQVGATVTPQPVLAVCAIPGGRDRLDLDVLRRDGLVIVGVALGDPGNVGTIIRSADAAGAAAIVLGPGSVDAYNPKVVRASAGAIFGIPVLSPGVAAGRRAGWEGWSAVDALEALGDIGRRRLGAVAADGTPYEAVDLIAASALVLGNEAHGLDAGTMALLDEQVTIPMAAGAESLNVAMAATVLCFEAARQRRARR
jgi:TrmH family RNA methyltransferase